MLAQILDTKQESLGGGSNQKFNADNLKQCFAWKEGQIVREPLTTLVPAGMCSSQMKEVPKDYSKTPSYLCLNPSNPENPLSQDLTSDNFGLIKVGKITYDKKLFIVYNPFSGKQKNI